METKKLDREHIDLKTSKFESGDVLAHLVADLLGEEIGS